MLSNRLMTRPQLMRDIFPRGAPEQIAEIKHPKYHRHAVRPAVGLCDAARSSVVLASVHLAKRTVWSLAEARASLERLVGLAEEWSPLDDYLMKYVINPRSARHGVRVQLPRRRSNSCARARSELEPERSVRPDLFSQAARAQPAADVMSAPDMPADQAEEGRPSHATSSAHKRVVEIDEESSEIAAVETSITEVPHSESEISEFETSEFEASESETFDVETTEISSAEAASADIAPPRRSRATPS